MGLTARVVQPAHLGEVPVISSCLSFLTQKTGREITFTSFPGGSAVENQPAMQEMWVRFLSPLEKEIATHSSILDWEIPWTEEPGGLQFMASQELDTTERLNNCNNNHIYLPGWLED